MKVIITKNYILNCPQYIDIKPNIGLCKNLKGAFLDVFWVNFIEHFQIKRIVDKNDNESKSNTSIVEVLLDLIEESKKFAYIRKTDVKSLDTEIKKYISYDEIYSDIIYASYIEALTLNEVVNDDYIETIDSRWSTYSKLNKKKITLKLNSLTHDVQYDKEFLREFLDRARNTAIAFKTL